MKELIEEIADKFADFIRIREIREIDGGSVIEPPYYLIRRKATVYNNFELLLKTADTEFEFEGDADSILDRLRELFLDEVEDE